MSIKTLVYQNPRFGYDAYVDVHQCTIHKDLAVIAALPRTQVNCTYQRLKSKLDACQATDLPSVQYPRLGQDIKDYLLYRYVATGEAVPIKCAS
jgi:hypothetical protein